MALAIPLATAGCSSDDDGGGGAAEGDHYRYVVATLDTRATNKLDIDGDGKSENKLGDLVGLLTALQFDVQGAVNEAVADGTALLLADLQATSFSAAANAGFSVYLGDSATVMPAPCTDVTMIATCGQHLKGTGAFTIAATSPRDTQLTGPIAGGTLKAGPGQIAIQIALTGAPITVNLVSARAQISGLSADGIDGGLLGGAVTESELNDSVYPSVLGQLNAVVARDCGPENQRMLSGTDCGYNDGTFHACVSTGATLLSAIAGFDTITRDCKITLEELKANPAIASGLKPDLTIDGQKAVSVVLGFTAKKATFTP